MTVRLGTISCTRAPCCHSRNSYPRQRFLPAHLECRRSIGSRRSPFQGLRVPWLARCGDEGPGSFLGLRMRSSVCSGQLSLRHSGWKGQVGTFHRRRPAESERLLHDGFNVYVGSRLTISETESAWNIQFPLLLFAAIHATDSLLGAVPGALAGTDSDDSASAWGEEDFEHVESFLSRICVCTAGRSGLTAEFALAHIIREAV